MQLQALPFEMLDIIAANEPELNPQALALTCKQLYRWRCHYIAKDATRLSDYVRRLLEMCSFEEATFSLSWFSQELPCKTSINLTATRFESRTLQLVSQTFPHAQKLTYSTPYIRPYQSRIRAIAEFLICLIIALPFILVELCISLPYFIKHRIRTGSFKNFTGPPINKKITKLLRNVIAKLGLLRISTALPLENLTKYFPNHKIVEIHVSKGTTELGIFDAIGIDLPKLPTLRTLRIKNSSANHCLFDVRPCSELRSLELVGDLSSNSKFPKSLEVFSVRKASEFYPEVMFKKCHLLKSFFYNAEFGRINFEGIVPGSGNNLETLTFISHQGRHADKIFTAFPNLQSLTIISKPPQYAPHLPPSLQETLLQLTESKTLTHFAFYAENDRAPIERIFTLFPNLKTLTYSSPHIIAIPASHPDLVIKSVSAEEIDS